MILTLLLALHLAIAVASAVHLLLGYRRPASAVAWLFALLLLPFVGPLLYAMLSVPDGSGRTLRRRQQAAGVRGSRDDSHHREVDEYDGTTAARTPFPLTDGNEVELVGDCDAALREQLNAIADAEHEILLSTYVLKPGSVQRALFDVLVARAEAGVRIRVLVDPIGSHELGSRALEQLASSGVEALTFLAPNPLKGRLQVNFRNHRKILCIDGTLAYTGGRNWSNEYYSTGEARETPPFRDTTVRLRGPVVAGMRRVFLEDWALATDDESVLDEPAPRDGVGIDADAGERRARVHPFGPDEPQSSVLDVFGLMFRAARDSIFIATPYFVPGPTLFHALRFAALSGVDVVLLAPRTCGKRSIDLTARNYFDGLLDVGATIHLREPPLMHAKAVIVDGRWTSIGSVNFDARSVRLNYELNVEVVDEAFARSLRRFFDDDLAHAEQLDVERFRSRGRWQHMKERIAALFEPLM